MKHRVILNKETGKVIGYLDKELYEVFKYQRYKELFHIQKVDEEELEEFFGFKNLGNYAPVMIEDLIVFPYEEVECIERIHDNIFQAYYSMGDRVNSLVKSFNLTSDEDMIIRVAVATALIKMEELMKVQSYIEKETNYRQLLKEQLYEFGLRKDYK